MRVVAIPLILLGYIITVTTCDSTYSKEYQPRSNSLTYDVLSDNEGETMLKRSGLERRAYTYTAGSPGAKRLPNYNFGLGKRARPYEFGLGKRADDNDYIDSRTGISYDQLKSLLPLLAEKQVVDEDFNSEKRARPYRFGLGKRFVVKDDGLERRSVPQRYDFGLGR